MMKKLSEMSPTYIPLKEIVKKPLRFEWDYEFPFSLIEEGSFDTIRKLEKLTNRGLIAYSVGCGEWIVYRMSKVLDKKLPYYYMESYWAYIMGRQELFEYPPELIHEEWLSYEKSPIDCAISSIMNVIYLSEYYDPPVNDAAQISQLAKHVLEDEVLFTTWEENILDRLLKFSSKIEGEGEDEPIPRQLMDTRIEYDGKNKNKLIQINFQSKDFSSNPYFIGDS